MIYNTWMSKVFKKMKKKKILGLIFFWFFKKKIIYLQDAGLIKNYTLYNFNES